MVHTVVLLDSVLAGCETLVRLPKSRGYLRRGKWNEESTLFSHHGAEEKWLRETTQAALDGTTGHVYHLPRCIFIMQQTRAQRNVDQSGPGASAARIIPSFPTIMPFHYPGCMSIIIASTRSKNGTTRAADKKSELSGHTRC
jgi:hypothetical protein